MRLLPKDYDENALEALRSSFINYHTSKKGIAT